MLALVFVIVLVVALGLREFLYTNIVFPAATSAPLNSDVITVNYCGHGKGGAIHRNYGAAPINYSGSRNCFWHVGYGKIAKPSRRDSGVIWHSNVFVGLHGGDFIIPIKKHPAVNVGDSRAAIADIGNVNPHCLVAALDTNRADSQSRPVRGVELLSGELKRVVRSGPKLAGVAHQQNGGDGQNDRCGRNNDVRHDSPPIMRRLLFYIAGLCGAGRSGVIGAAYLDSGRRGVAVGIFAFGITLGCVFAVLLAVTPIRATWS